MTYQPFRSAVLGIVLGAAMLCLGPTPRDASVRQIPLDELARREQVRLRKLHLVRPDLIPYPISFEVYC